MALERAKALVALAALGAGGCGVSVQRAPQPTGAPLIAIFKAVDCSDGDHGQFSPIGVKPDGSGDFMLGFWSADKRQVVTVRRTPPSIAIGSGSDSFSTTPVRVHQGVNEKPVFTVTPVEGGASVLPGCDGDQPLG